MSAQTEFLFNILTPLGFPARTSQHYWDKILAKHPDLAGRLEEVKEALASPEQIRRSSRDERILLFYRAATKRWIVAAVPRLNSDGVW